MPQTVTCTSRHGVAQILAAWGLVALGTVNGLATAADPDSRKPPETIAVKGEDGWPLIPLRSQGEGVKMTATLVSTGDSKSAPAAEGGIAGELCPPVISTYSSFPWINGASFVAQAGFVAQEIAAAEYVLPASSFPVHIDLMEALFGTQNPSEQITTQWSVLVWQGPPNTGILLAEYSSDGIILQPMVLNPPANAIQLQVSVDPNDPDQIIIADNPTHSFTLGFRIDVMNDPPTSSCNAGFTPAPCCPHTPSTNIFPTTDVGGLQQPTKNWLYARPNCGLGSLSGWYKFSQLGLSTPSGDWNLRVTYTPSGCVTPTGSCCISGSCSVLTASECAGVGGSYLGDGTNCQSNPCPIPTGACCINGNCSIQTSTACAASGGTFLGAGSTCNANSCKGACCVPATQQCVFTSQSNCAAVNGIFQGVGVTCGSIVCFPIGACCLPDGSCVGGQSPAQCAGQGGVFQGNATSCASVTCPIPTGSCCLGSICLTDLTEDDCTVGFGGTWQGAASTCETTTCAPKCPADIAPNPGDGQVNIDDLLAIINNWGPCFGPGCHADVAPPGGNGQINIDDLLFIINHWGPC